MLKPGPSYVALLCLAALAPLLSGCGQSPGAEGDGAKRGIYTSAADCADGGRLTIEACARIIEAAVVEHEATAPSYSSLKSCETAEGTERCERAASGRYRPRLLAFLVVASNPPVAHPLYATQKGEAGFRTGDRKNLLASDETLSFSRHAVAAYEANVGTGKRAGFSF